MSNINSKSTNDETIVFDEALSSRYLAYAVTTIKSRSLPDVRDGLKPVHRRILYAMLSLKLSPSSGFKKCARVVGDVVGKYHPHGDIAIYDAMVRMAQSFASRYPLVEGQGNFGSIDGDSQAAMRYTEAKLTPYAMLLLHGIDEDAVDFVENYDESEKEPEVLPAIVPNLLANGAEGIAVGMATSIPPHNLKELVDASIYCLKTKAPKLERLLEFVQGPDLPTGGVINASELEIAQIYGVGKGSFKVRAKYHVEELSRGGFNVIVTEIPYMVTKKALIEKLAGLLIGKKLPLVETFQDQSAEDIRIVITPKSRNVEPEILMESIFRHSEFESRVSVNMNAINSAGAPHQLGLLEILQEHCQHLRSFYTRKLNFRLAKVLNRIEILEGYIIAYLNLDEVIHIIRNEDEPKPILMKKFSLSDVQAESILNMRLRSLRKLEEVAIRAELSDLQAERKELEGLLSIDEELTTFLVKELREAMKKFPDKEVLKRRTVIDKDAKVIEFNEQQFTPKENITIMISKQGWVKAQKGHGLENLKYKQGDSAQFELEGNTADKLIFFSDAGKAYCINASEIASGKGDGDPLKLLFSLDLKEKIINAFVLKEEDRYIIASSDGYGFVIDAEAMVSQTKNGKQILNVKEPNNAMFCERVIGDTVAAVGENRRLIIFPVSELPELRRGKGVIIQRFKQGKLKGLKSFELDSGLSWRKSKRSRSLDNLKLYEAKRGSQGKIVLTKLWVD